MILRKPYAFFIKYFRWFHIAIAFLSAFLIFKAIKLSSFFSDYSKNNQLMISDFNVGDYLTIGTFLLAFLIIVLNVILLSVMIIKKKPFVQYIYNLITYIAVIIVFGFDLSTLRVVSYQAINVTVVSLLRDFSKIVVLLQIATFGLTIIRATGFDIKKFDFAEDLEKLKIDVEDNEEFEVAIEFDKNKIKRKIKRIIRYAKYVVVENKFFVFVSGTVIVLFISLMVYFNVGIYSMYVKENEPFAASGVVLNVIDSYITNKDSKGNSLGDNSLVVVKIDVRSNNKIIDQLNIGNATLKIKKYSFEAVPKENPAVKDLGEAYYNEKLTFDNKTYLLIYKIPNNLRKEKKIFKFNDNNSYIRGEVGAKNVYVKLDPINLDQGQENKRVNIGDNLNLKDSILKNTNVSINKYEIADNFKIDYKYCYDDNKCIDSSEYIYPSTTSNFNKVVMKLEGTFEMDNSLQMENMLDLYDFLYSFGTLTYVVDGKTYIHPTELNRIKSKKTNTKNTYYIEVVPELKKATSIYFDIKIRNQLYQYSLK